MKQVKNKNRLQCRHDATQRFRLLQTNLLFLINDGEDDIDVTAEVKVSEGNE